ncbi:MAG: PQQ-binding-like beta-propeller repeat protein, partial [Acidobacteriia bacterium]|nr:PQQ-binding-like beta-propeller repeat protein [Terriglobia bacterium]
MRVLLLLAPLLFTVHAADWRQFRGPNGSGLSTETGLPVEMSPTKNLVWKTTLPGGYSSPVVTANRIFLTAREDDILYTFCLDRATGKELWRREGGRTPVPKPKPARIPAAPTPVTDGANVYVVFDEFGLISYDA